MQARPELVCVGAIAGAFGVRGEVRVKSFCAEPAAIGDYGPLLTEDGRQFTLTVLRPVSGGLACRLSGVRSREEAQALKGTRLHVRREALPPLPEDEFYHADLIGLAVFDPGGRQIGRLRAVADHGAGDVLEIERPGRNAPLMLPFTRAFVPLVDLEAGRIVVDPPEEE
ncbi:MAG: ribosome maturation factor RimM [Alphaproteobacteria bacterium]|nr:MAG: ribosome maturation factor RimM [Alphaproteobacteria bacterium]